MLIDFVKLCEVRILVNCFKDKSMYSNEMIICAWITTRIHVRLKYDLTKSEDLFLVQHTNMGSRKASSIISLDSPPLKG